MSSMCPIFVRACPSGSTVDCRGLALKATITGGVVDGELELQ